MAGSSQGRRDEVEGSTTQLRSELAKKVREVTPRQLHGMRRIGQPWTQLSDMPLPAQKSV